MKKIDKVFVNNMLMGGGLEFYILINNISKKDYELISSINTRVFS